MGPPPLRASTPPPLRTATPPSLAAARAAPADVALLVPEHAGAPIAPIASALEPAPAAPAPSEQPDLPARKPRTYRALALGVAATIALVAIAATQALKHESGQAPAPAARAAAVEPPGKAQERPQARAELATKAAPGDAAEPAHGQIGPTPIPRGSEAAELLQRAKQARDEARHKESEALLSQVLARYPGDFGARYHMALTLVRLRRFDEAHAQLSKALELNSESASAWLLKGDIFLQQGRRRDSLRAWNRCLELQADFPTCQERLARWRLR